MTTKDKTGDRLIDSIRKTKTGPTTAAVRSEKSSVGSIKAASKKNASEVPVRRKSSPTTQKPAARKKTATSKATSDAKKYLHSECEVWPD